MLPGLCLTATKPSHICTYLKKLDLDIKTNSCQSLSSYLSSLCYTTCHDLIRMKHRHNECTLTDKNPSVRKNCLQILPKRELTEFFNDPNHLVRAAAITKSRSCVEILDCLNDRYSDVRLAVLDKLYNPTYLKKLNSNIQEKIFVQVCEMINDIDVSVRQKVSYVLRNFTHIRNDQIKSLLTKTDEDMKIKLGTFVHGLEDENETVRVNIIGSMCKLIKTDEAANVVFDFLLDALDDVIEKVKETAGINIYEKVRQFKISVSCEMVDMIFFNFEERNEEVKACLFDAIPYLLCDDGCLAHIFDRFIGLLDKNIDKERIHECVKKLTQENLKYFKKYIENNAEFKRANKPALIDNRHYMHVIVLAEILKKAKNIKYPEYLEKHLFYYNLKNTQTIPLLEVCETLESINTNDMIKRQKLDYKKDIKYFMCQLLSNPNKDKSVLMRYRTIFMSKFAKTSLDYFYIKLYKVLLIYYLEKDVSQYQKLKVVYNFNVDIDYLLTFIENLTNIEKGNFCLICPREIYRSFMLPLRFEVKAQYNPDISNIFIKLSSNEFIRYFALRKKSYIHVHEQINRFSIAIVKKSVAGDIYITRPKKIRAYDCK